MGEFGSRVPTYTGQRRDQKNKAGTITKDHQEKEKAGQGTSQPASSEELCPKHEVILVSRLKQLSARGPPRWEGESHTTAGHKITRKAGPQYQEKQDRNKESKIETRNTSSRTETRNTSIRTETRDTSSRTETKNTSSRTETKKHTGPSRIETRNTSSRTETRNTSSRTRNNKTRREERRE